MYVFYMCLCSYHPFCRGSGPRAPKAHESEGGWRESPLQKEPLPSKPEAPSPGVGRTNRKPLEWIPHLAKGLPLHKWLTALNTPSTKPR
jgi:hypothetical protein